MMAPFFFCPSQSKNLEGPKVVGEVLTQGSGFPSLGGALFACVAQLNGSGELPQMITSPSSFLARRPRSP